MSANKNQAFQNVHYLEIEAERAGQRIDNFLVGYLKHVPKSHVYRILRKGEVRVNKKRVKASYRLVAGDILRLPPIRVADKTTHTLHLNKDLIRYIRSICQEIIFQNNDFMLLDKPAGLAVHGGSKVLYGLLELLRSDYSLCDVPESAEFHQRRTALELVHRLDKDTSGCLLIAKNRQALLTLQSLFKDRAINKTYIALLKGTIREDAFSVEVPLREDVEIGGEKLVVVDAQKGKISRSEFEVLERYAKATLVKVRLITGRKHQIRVHTRHIGHPIIGDKKYGEKSTNAAFKTLGAYRLCLHAHSLVFAYQGEHIAVESPLPEAMLALCNTLKQGRE